MTTDSEPLRVAIITMRWPAPSETFAAVDVRQLVGQGAVVRVDAMRGALPEARRMAAERGVAGLPGGPAGIADLWPALVEAACHPILTAGLIGCALAWGWRRPRHLLAGLALVPRSLALARQLPSWRPDVVHIFWGHFPALAGWLLRRRMPGCALSIFLGAYDAEVGYAGSTVVAGEADVLLTHAEVNRVDLARLGIDPARAEVVYRGIDPSHLARSDRTKIPGRIVLASRLVADKRVVDALRAFAAARAICPQASLLVLGDGPERAALERQAVEYGLGGAVEFAGHVEHGRVFDELDRAEVFLLLSGKASERLPNAVKEAMACGCAVVTTATPGIAELVEDGVTGAIVPMGDVEAAGRALGGILADRSRRTAMAAAARLAVRARFDAGVSIRRQLALWRAASARRRGG